MILAVPKNILTKAQKAAATKKGYLIIECDDPDKIRVINPEQSMDNTDWFMAALQAMTVETPIGKQERFINNLYTRLNKNSQP